MKLNLDILLILLLGVLPLQSCGSDSKSDAPDVKDSINTSIEQLHYTDAGGSEVIEVNATGEWDAVSTAAWFSLAKTGTLSTTGAVTVTVDKNTSRDSRTGEITFMSGTARRKVVVSQDGKQPEPVDPSISVPDGYELVWHDEFDEGTVLDKTFWTHEVQGPGWVNNELQTYVNGSVDGLRVTAIENGILSINCFKHAGTIYSGRVYANVGTGWQYGIFEARIKLPKGRGTWPAFWMMPVNNDFAANPWPKCGEIDIMEEVGYHPDYTSSSIHCESYNHVLGTQKTAERYTAGAEEDYHIYRLEWTKDYIATSVDGKGLLRFDNDGRGNVSTWPFDKPFYIILNLAWGGSWGGAQGVDESALPVTMEVDYVRVFQPK